MAAIMFKSQCANPLSPGDAFMRHWTGLSLVQVMACRKCWIIVNWALKNKLKWNLNWNSNIFIEENVIENIVCKMAVILPRPQCVKCRI